MSTMRLLSVSVTLVSLILGSGLVLAQEPEQEGNRPRRPGIGRPAAGARPRIGQRQQLGQRPVQPTVPPILAALDTDKNGVLSSEEIAKASTALMTLDANKDGQLDRTELLGRGAIRQRAGAQGGAPGGPQAAAAVQQRVGQLISNNDENKDGKLSREELPEQLRRAFGRIDADGDGFLSSEELTTAFSRFANGRPGAGGPGGRQRPNRSRSEPPTPSID